MPVELVELKVEREKRLNCDRKKLSVATNKQCADYLSKLLRAVNDIKSLADNPNYNFSKAFSEPEMLKSAETIYWAVYQGICYGEKLKNSEKNRIITEKQVLEIYERVERHLLKSGHWGDTIGKLPEKAVKSAIRRIIFCFESIGKVADLDCFDWVIVFERLREFQNIDDFIAYLFKEKTIPREPFSELFLSDAAFKDLKNIMEKAGYLDMVVLPKSDYAELLDKAKKWKEIENLWIG